MPIYEYECLDCSHRFELQRKIDDRDSKTKCPKCGSEHAQRAFGSFISPQFKGVHFKSQVEGAKFGTKVYPPPRKKSIRWGHSHPMPPLGKQ